MCNCVFFLNFISYVLSVVEKLVVDDYVLVYLHSGAPRNSMPGIQWFHKFYRMIDRRYNHYYYSYVTITNSEDSGYTI